MKFVYIILVLLIAIAADIPGRWLPGKLRKYTGVKSIIRIALAICLAAVALVLACQDGNRTKRGATSGELRPIASIADVTVPKIWINDYVISVRTRGGTIFVDDNRPVLSATIIDGKLKVSMTVFSNSGELAAELVDNEWELNENAVYKRNFSDNAVEIIDNTGAVILQVINFGPAVYIAGILYNGDGVCYSVGGRLQDHGSVRPLIYAWLRGQEPIVVIDPIFRYPTESNLGVFLAEDELIHKMEAAWPNVEQATLTNAMSISSSTVGLSSGPNRRGALYLGELGTDIQGLPVLSTEFFLKSQIDTILSIAALNAKIDASQTDGARHIMNSGPLKYVVGIYAPDDSGLTKVAMTAYSAADDCYYLSTKWYDDVPRFEQHFFEMSGTPVSRDDLRARIGRTYPGFLCMPSVTRLFDAVPGFDFVAFTYLDAAGALIVQQHVLEISPVMVRPSLPQIGRCEFWGQVGDERDQ